MTHTQFRISVGSTICIAGRVVVPPKSRLRIILSPQSIVALHDAQPGPSLRVKEPPNLVGGASLAAFDICTDLLARHLWRAPESQLFLSMNRV